MNNWPTIIQDWFYPPTCLLCGDPAEKAGRDLCLACAESLPVNQPACRRCGLALAASTFEICGRCQQKLPAFDIAHVLFRYEDPVRHLIHNLKFRADYACARLLGQLMAEALADVAERPDCLIPVPLHSRRYRERGFNQSLEIARTVSRRLTIPVDYACCIRCRPTQPQPELNASERLRNLRKAFQVIRALPGDHVAIVDDVVTTGATVNELAKVLRAAGATRIEVWACARA